MKKEKKNNVGVNDTQKQILKLIKENNIITQKEIANKLKITKRTVERNINVLKKQGFLQRIGSDKTGYWKIND